MVDVAGEVDGDAATRLTAVTAQLATTLSERVVVDLAEVCFAGAALPTFLARLRGADGRRPVEVCHASATTVLMLRLTRMGDLLTSDGAHGREGSVCGVPPRVSIRVASVGASAAETPAAPSSPPYLSARSERSVAGPAGKIRGVA